MSPFDNSEDTMYTVREAGPLARELRESKGWTQAEAAKRAGVSRSFLIDLESGKPSVEASKLMDVFQALGYEMAIRDRNSGEVRW